MQYISCDAYWNCLLILAVLSAISWEKQALQNFEKFRSIQFWTCDASRMPQRSTLFCS